MTFAFMPYRLAVIAMILALSGCIYLPHIGSDNRSIEETAEVVEGSSTREEITSLLGEPDFTALDDSIAVYDYSRITGHVIGVPIPVPGLGAIGVDFYNPVEKLESTQIEYADGVVVSISSIADGYGCYSNGVCLDSGWTTLGGPRLVQGMTALSTTRFDDQKAKQFLSPESGCNLYVYAVGGVRPEYPVLVGIDDDAVFPLSLNNYLNLQIPPGRISLQVFHSGTEFVRSSERELLKEADLICKKPSIDFVEIKYEMGRAGPNVRTAEVLLADQEKARSEILERRLLLLP